MVKNSIISLDNKQFPYFKILLIYMMGIIAAYQSRESIGSIHWIEYTLAVCLIFYLISNIFFRNRCSDSLSTILLYVSIFGIGFYQFIRLEPTLKSNYFSHAPATQYVARVLDEPVEKEKSIRFPVEIQAALDTSTNRKVVGKVIVTLLKDSIDMPSIEYGDLILFRNKITTVNPPYNPLQFDYKSYLETKRIYHQALLKSEDFKIVDRNKGNPILSYSFKMRQRLVAKFRTYIASDRSFQIASALIFGYRLSMDQEVLDSFLKTGTIHVLSVSGLHVTIVFVFLNFLLTWIDRYRFGKVVRYIVVLGLIWCYVVLTGMAAPVLRSGVMISFYIAGEWINRRHSSFNALAASAFLLLLINPKMLFEIGFQLSYMAMIGLSTFLVFLQQLYTSKNKWIDYATSTAYVSVAAQLTTLPMIISYFGQFPNYFLIANFFIAIPSILMMYIGILLALLPWEFISRIFGWLLNHVIEFTFQGLQWIAHLPMANITIYHVGALPLILLSLSILFLFYAWNNKNKLFLMYCCLLIIFYSIQIQYQQIQKYNFDGLKIYNVNQHLAFARIKNNKVILFSSLDSITHSVLQYNVMADIRLHSPVNEVTFKHVALQERKNYFIQANGISISIAEGYIRDHPFSQSDIVLIRKNNSLDLTKLSDSTGNFLFVLDGSNANNYVVDMSELLSQKNIPFYTLKNNYAYVWNKVNKE